METIHSHSNTIYFNTLKINLLIT